MLDCLGLAALERANDCETAPPRKPALAVDSDGIQNLANGREVR